MGDYTTYALVAETLPKAVQSMTSVNTATIVHFIKQAESIMNGKLAKLYSVPISESAMLETIATDLACYRLLRRLFTQEKKNTSSWVDQFEGADDDLDAIMKGEISLVNSTGGVIAKSVAQVWSNNEDYNPTFDEASMENSFVDPDKLEDISDAKND